MNCPLWKGLRQGVVARPSHTHARKKPRRGGAFLKRLLRFSERTASAALPLADHLHAFLACGDTVAIAFEDFLRSPADDGRGVLGAVELFGKLDFELFDVCHVSVVVG